MIYIYIYNVHILYMHACIYSMHTYDICNITWYTPEVILIFVLKPMAVLRDLVMKNPGLCQLQQCHGIFWGLWALEASLGPFYIAAQRRLDPAAMGGCNFWWWEFSPKSWGWILNSKNGQVGCISKIFFGKIRFFKKKHLMSRQILYIYISENPY